MKYVKLFEEFINEGKEQRKGETFSSRTLLIQNLSKVQKLIDKLEKEYPDYRITLTNNARWKPERKDLRGTYTLSTYGLADDNFTKKVNIIYKKANN